MTTFNFSDYDYEEIPENKVNESIPKRDKLKTVSTDFDFSQFDNNFDFSQFDSDTPSETNTDKEMRESAEADPMYQQFAPRKIDSEIVKNMSVQEKLDFIKENKTAQEYLSSAGLTKGALSGATLGFSEKIPGLKPKPHELGSGFGELVGTALPITGISKAIAKPSAMLASKLLPKSKGVEAVTKFLTAFGTGTAFSTGKQLSGDEEFSPLSAAGEGLGFATVSAIIHGTGKLGKWIKSKTPSQQAAILEERIIPKDLPKSQHDTAREILALLDADIPRSPGFQGLPFGVGQQAGEGQTGRSLLGRARQTTGTGLVPRQPNPRAPLEDQVGNIFSNQRFYNNTTGGTLIKNEIMSLDEDIYRGVGDLYNLSRELNRGINEIHPQLSGSLQGIINELNTIPEPSDVQRRLLRTANSILDELVVWHPVLNEEGQVIAHNIGGYTPINNQTLIDQIQSLRQIVDYDFAHGKVKNIFRPIINNLQDAVIHAAESTGNETAAQAHREARHAHRAWTETFNNDDINPFRDRSNRDFSKLYKNILEPDKSNVVGQILNLSNEGMQLNRSLQRDYVEKSLSRFFENPAEHTSREFNTALRELEAVITPEQAQLVRERFTEAARRPTFSYRRPRPRIITNDERIAAEYIGKKPEDIKKMMDTVSGIRKLRTDLSSNRIKEQNFTRLSQQKMRSIFRSGNIESDFAGNDLYKMLNKEKNYEILSELLGEQETESMRLLAKEIGEKQVKSEVRKKAIKSVSKHAAALKGLDIIFSVL